MTYTARPRHGHHEPIVPAIEGKPPTWVVACLDCGFCHDAHGGDAEAAIRSVAHEPSHKLTAQAIDYTQGWERPGRSLQEAPTTAGGHPIYFP